MLAVPGPHPLDTVTLRELACCYFDPASDGDQSSRPGVWFALHAHFLGRHEARPVTLPKVFRGVEAGVVGATQEPAPLLLGPSQWRREEVGLEHLAIVNVCGGEGGDDDNLRPANSEVGSEAVK